MEKHYKAIITPKKFSSTNCEIYRCFNKSVHTIMGEDSPLSMGFNVCQGHLEEIFDQAVKHIPIEKLSEIFMGNMTKELKEVLLEQLTEEISLINKKLYEIDNLTRPELIKFAKEKGIKGKIATMSTIVLKEKLKEGGLV